LTIVIIIVISLLLRTTVTFISFFCSILKATPQTAYSGDSSANPGFWTSKQRRRMNCEKQQKTENNGFASHGRTAAKWSRWRHSAAAAASKSIVDNLRHEVISSSSSSSDGDERNLSRRMSGNQLA